MTKVEILKLHSRYSIKEILSYLDNEYAFQLIKYNKKLQKLLDINFQDTIYNYEYSIKTKKEILSDIKRMIKELKSKSKHYDYLSELSLSGKFFLKYSYFFAEDLQKKGPILFLIKYRGFKINDYPLPFNFEIMDFHDKINVLKNNAYFMKYILNDEQIELINLINKLRNKKNLGNLLYNKNERLYDYYNFQKSNIQKTLLIYQVGEVKKKILQKDNYILEILTNKYMKYIMILEKENNEYIFIYSDKNEKDRLEAPLNSCSSKFHLINNIMPEIKSDSSKRFFIVKKLNFCLNYEGFQIFSFKKDTLIGVFEGRLIHLMKTDIFYLK